jgi:pyridoxal phosphate enzyme (YggS family)
MNQRKVQLSANLEVVTTRIDAAAKAAGREPSAITLVVVTKTFPVEDIHLLYELGVRNFGENRDQEGAVKAPALPSDCIWHFQGQIQSNKIKSILNWADVIHSLDDLKHAAKIAEIGSNAQLLVQVALEQVLRVERGGVDPLKIEEFLERAIEGYKLNLVGLMAVAPIGDLPERAFEELAALRDRLSRRWPQLVKLSAGMSNDFEAAISAGATLVRVGSSILGSRPQRL